MYVDNAFLVKTINKIMFCYFLSEENYSVVNDAVQGNPDIITVAYTTSAVYVSRACGSVERRVEDEDWT